MTPPLVLVPQHFGALVFDRRTSRYSPFDHETAELLAAAIDTSVYALAGAEEDDARRSLLYDFIEVFEEASYFRPDGRFAGVALEATPPADHLLGPLAVHLEVIAACNLSCTHCFAGDLPRKSDLSLAEMDRLFGELASLGSFRLGLTGGEPLLRKDLLQVVDAATSHGLHPCLTTNGMFLDERMARELGQRELVWLNISLDGATARTNDAVRGQGTFDAVVERLRAVGRHMRFTLAFTLTSESVKEATQCAELARALGAHTAVFRPVYPAGSARGRPELMPTFAEYSDALSSIASLPSSVVGAIDPFGPTARVETQAKTFSPAGCGAANLIASISATGEVNPCSFLGTAYDAGSLRARSFREIWDDSFMFRTMRGISESACAADVARDRSPRTAMWTLRIPGSTNGSRAARGTRRCDRRSPQWK
jgi:MoaA/NifB/PqqE/SkfB family radical SAM enzyme